MKKIGIITDAHANLPALEAALGALEEAGCEEVVHTGDAIGIGPYPAECLDLLLNRPHTHLLMGNHDALFVTGLPDTQPTWMRGGEYGHQRWTHAQLDTGLRDVVATWPYTIDRTFGPARVTFCHYPRNPEHSGFVPVVMDPEPVDMERLFGTQADIVFYGHHHPTSDLQGNSRYINPGALGCHLLPEARFAILTAGDTGIREVSLHAVPYDRARLIRAFRDRDVSGADSILRMFFGQ